MRSMTTNMYVVLCFFFFQAEDGIRDYKVTGVQTCALPISLLPAPGRALPDLRSGAYYAHRIGWIDLVPQDEGQLVVRSPIRLGIAGLRPQRCGEARQCRWPERVRRGHLPSNEAAGLVPELQLCPERVLGIRLWWRPPGPVQRALRPGGFEELLGSELIRRLPAAFTRPFRHARRSRDGNARLVELGRPPRQQVRREELLGRARLLRRGRAGRSDVSPERGGLDPAVDPLPVLGYSELSAGNFPASVPDDIHWWRPGGDLRLALRLRAHRPEHVPDAAARELHDRS